MAYRNPILIECLHVFVLTGFAVAQPVYDLLGQNPEFLVSHRASPLLITSMVLILSFGLPLVLCLLKLILLPLNYRLQRGAHLLIILLLTVLTLLPLVKRLLPEDGFPVLAGALVASGIFIGLYAGLRPVRMIMNFLAPAIIIFPLWFMLMTPVSRLVLPQDVQAIGQAHIKKPAPIVLIVFDEFNTRSLLDEKGRIDSLRFPNFAELADQSFWFPNAVGPHIQTMQALPAILTGKMAKKGLNPTATDYPRNLFTLLGGVYQINALEAETNLCPQSICDFDAYSDQARENVNYWIDLGIIYLHIIAPPAQARSLPGLDGQWTGFAQAGADPENQTADSPRGMFQRTEQFETFLAGIDTSQNNQLHFLHIIFPHIPYTYLSTGQVYNRSINHIFPEGIRNEESGWSEEYDLVKVAYLQYLHQTGYTDHLLGRLMQKLKANDIYDKSLIIITADHGVAFQSGLPRRGIAPETVRDVLKVPMLIKLPGQEQGRIKDNLVSGMDILPTIADILGVELKWPLHGRSVFSREALAREKLELFDDITLKFDNIEGFPQLEWQIKNFGSGTPLAYLGTKGPFEDLIGRNLSELSIEHSEHLQYTSEMTPHFQQVDPDSDFLPALFSGYITGTDDLALPLAVALNGRIRATSRSAEWLQMERYFVVLLPSIAFQPGVNDIQLFWIKEGEHKPSLLRIPGLQETMVALESKHRLEGRDVLVLQNERIPLESSPDIIRGYVDYLEQKENTLLLRGWSGDQQYKPVKSVLVFSGQDFLAEIKPVIFRKDVVRHFNQQSMLYSGFQVLIPFDPEQDDLDQIRIIAVSRDQKARELPWTN